MPPPYGASDPHKARQVAESFGTNAERYDRTRPRFPEALVATSEIDAVGGSFVMDYAAVAVIAVLADR